MKDMKNRKGLLARLNGKLEAFSNRKNVELDNILVIALIVLGAIAIVAVMWTVAVLLLSLN